ncbi:MAG: hypothetical protein HY979_02600 [Candidatus Magasanikbacteria bacterium]|nr:hypothetical protein [Candidatus Magasanikbacteria bacterium]
MWSKYVTRRLAVQVAQAWNFGWGKAMKKVFGLSVDDTLVFRDDKKTEYYVDQKQHKKYISGLYKLLENKQFVKNFHHDAQKELEKILRNTEIKFSQDLNKFSNNQLLSVYKNFVLPNLEQFYIRMWTVFNINEPLVDTIRQELIKILKNSKQVDKYMLSLSSPLVPNDVLLERMDSLHLASLKNKIAADKFRRLLEFHVSKFRHIPMFDFDHEPYSYSYFFAQIKNLKIFLNFYKKMFFYGIIEI